MSRTVPVWDFNVQLTVLFGYLPFAEIVAAKRKPNRKDWLQPDDRYNMPTVASMRASMDADDWGLIRCASVIQIIKFIAIN